MRLTSNRQKSRGFEGEMIIEVPQVALHQIQRTPLIHSLYIARMGFYPNAMHHYYQRPKGISQVILLYCINGTGFILINKKKCILSAGEVYLIPLHTPHVYGATENNPWTIFWLHLAGPLCNDAVAAITGSNKAATKGLPVGFSDWRNDIFNQIADTFLKGYSELNLMFANLLLQYYLATFIAPDKFQPKIAAPQNNDATDKAILYMQQHLSQPLTLNSIAGAAHLSASFFSKKFKGDTGYAPIEYFNHLRIQQACQLLHFSKLRINEVASQIGIDDPFYFSRLFKKQMGISPVKYRKNEALSR